MDIVEQTDQITLTPAAAQAVQDLLAQKDLTGYSLRMFISGGGCSGYQYGMALDNRVRDTDTTSTQHGVQLIVDEMSINYLRGATVDFVNEAMGSGFKITNPNAMPACECGQSSDASDNGESGGCGGSCSCGQ